MLESTVTSCEDCPLGRWDGGCTFRARSLPRGTALWSEGEAVPYLALIRDGVVGLTAGTASGEQLSSAVRGPRAMLGLEALQGERASLTATTLTAVTVCVASTAKVKEEVALATDGPRHPKGAAILLELALAELRAVRRDVALRSGRSTARLARFLIAWHDLVATGRRGPFSHHHVAQLLGMRAETLSRCLRRLGEEGVLSTEGAGIAIEDHRRLAELAEETLVA